MDQIHVEGRGGRFKSKEIGGVGMALAACFCGVFFARNIGGGRVLKRSRQFIRRIFAYSISSLVFWQVQGSLSKAVINELCQMNGINPLSAFATSPR